MISWLLFLWTLLEIDTHTDNKIAILVGRVQDILSLLWRGRVKSPPPTHTHTHQIAIGEALAIRNVAYQFHGHYSKVHCEGSNLGSNRSIWKLFVFDRNQFVLIVGHSLTLSCYLSFFLFLSITLGRSIRLHAELM